MKVNLYTHVIFRNQALVPVWVEVMCCVPKVPTSDTPKTSFEDGLADVGAPSATHALIRASDSDMFKKAWSVVRTKKVTLLPGKSLSCSYSKTFSYDVAWHQEHTELYDTKIGGHSYFVMIKGPPPHHT